MNVISFKVVVIILILQTEKLHLWQKKNRGAFSLSDIAEKYVVYVNFPDSLSLLEVLGMNSSGFKIPLKN